MATIYTLTIDPITLGLTKPVDRVYIKNLYVDIDDTHIKTAAFEYSSSVVGEIGFAELPATTLGSIYQIQLFGSEGLVLSVFFGMPTRNTKLSELDIYTAYPPRNFYPEATIAWGQINGAIANQLDLSSVMFTKSNAATLQEAIDAKNLLQDNAIDLKASIYDVDNKNALQDSLISDLQAKDVSQDSAIALKASITYVDNKNLSQDGAIDDLQSKNLSQDNEIALRAKITDVDAKNLLQDTAIGSLQDKSTSHESAIALKANASDVDAKNLLQDNAISANAADIVAIQAYAPQDRTISATGDATWSVTFDGSKNVAGVMTVKKGSTAQAGLLKLNNSVSSTSTTEAATPNAVKTTYDLAASAIPAAEKGAINGVATLGADGKIPAEQFKPSATVLWGAITGDIAEQTDLTNLVYSKSEVNAKNDLQDTAITAAQNKANAAIPKTDKGAVNGVATLGADGKVTPTQLPDVTPVAWGNITGNIADQLDLSDLYYTKIEVDDINQFLFEGLIDVGRNGYYYDTTTTAYPNVNIAADGALSRSTATFGTAAGKDVGTATGNVMEVGAFGVGGNSSGGIPTMSNYLPNSFIATTPETVGSLGGYALGLQLNGANQWQVYLTLNVITGDMLIGNRTNPSSALSWGKVWTDKNTPASNLPVASIQAGIGAPKIAYKKLTGTTGAESVTTTLPHGLNASNILAVNALLSATNGNTYPPDQINTLSVYYNVWLTTTDVSIRVSSGAAFLAGRPIKILITYEVD